MSRYFRQVTLLLTFIGILSDNCHCSQPMSGDSGRLA